MKSMIKKAIRFTLKTNYCWSFVFAAFVGVVAGYFIFPGASDWCWWIIGGLGVIGITWVGLKIVLEEAVSCGILRIKEDDGA